MSVYDDIQAGKYANGAAYHVPKPEIDPERVTLAEAERMKEAHRKAIREQREAYRMTQAQITERLRADLEAENELSGHPKADMLWRFAYDRGHSAGYSEVALVYGELAELLK